MRLLLVGVMGCLWSVGVVQAGPRGAEPPRAGARVPKYCDPTCELQRQDQAFSLLVEIYRQHKAYLIQNQYEARLSAATAIGDKDDSLLIADDGEGVRALRGFVLRLAEEERELSLQQLQKQLEYLEVAYGCARRADEVDIGAQVPSQVNTAKAAAKLKDYVIVALRTPHDDRVHAIEPVPATSVLLDAAPVLPDEHRAIPPCE